MPNYLYDRNNDKQRDKLKYKILKLRMKNFIWLLNMKLGNFNYFIISLTLVLHVYYFFFNPKDFK